MKYIVRVLNKGSKLSVEGGNLHAILSEDAQKEWFDDMSEALTWMTSLSIYCSTAQKEKITKALDNIREVMSDLIFPRKADMGKRDFLGTFSFAYEVVFSSQRADRDK